MGIFIILRLVLRIIEMIFPACMCYVTLDGIQLRDVSGDQISDLGERVILVGSHYRHDPMNMRHITGLILRCSRQRLGQAEGTSHKPGILSELVLTWHDARCPILVLSEPEIRSVKTAARTVKAHAKARQVRENDTYTDVIMQHR